MAKQLFKDQNMSTLQDISEVDTSAAQTLISTMKALPFEYIIGAPLMACVKAQQASAQVAWDAIREIGFEPDEIGSDRSQEVSMVSFIFQHGGFSRKIRVPLLTLVPIPYMQIDSVDLKFRADMSATSEGQLTAKYSNTMDSQAARNSKYNVTNEIDINIHATTSGMPAGIAKLLDIFTNNCIDVSDYTPEDYSAEIIQAAKDEAERIKSEARAEVERLQQEVEDLKPETGQKPSQRPAVTPSERPEVKPKENQQSSMQEAFKEMYATLRDLSIEQRQAKAERSMKKFKGKRKHATSSDAQRAVSRNSVELRILWTILTGRGDFKGIENTGHPLHKHIDKINEYKRKCGQAELKVEAPAKETGKKPAVTPSERPEVKPKENQQSSMQEAFKEMYATLRDLSIEQRQAKAERSMKKFKGKRKHATSSDAQRAVSRNSVELRILWTILTGRGDFKGIENTGHPLHKHIDKINEYKRKCGQAELKVEAPAKETGKKPAATPVKVTYGVRVDSKYDKLPLITAIKGIMAISLKEAKDIVDNGPVIVPGGMTKADAEALVDKLIKKGYVSSVIVAQ